MLRYLLDIEPAWRPHAAYALDLLLEGIGVPGRPVEHPEEADLVYAPARPAAMPPDAVWIRAEGVHDWRGRVRGVGWVDALPVPYQVQPPPAGSTAYCDIAADLLYATFALATGAVARCLPTNTWGVPRVRGVHKAEASALEQPLVALYAHYLEQRLRRYAGASWRPLPRWPHGKRYAVVLSHDVDKPFAYPSYAFYQRRWRRDLQRRAWPQAFKSLAGLARAGLRGRFGLVPTPAADPHFCFDGWQALEHRLGARSCFYVAVTTAADAEGRAHDVDYDVRHPALVAALRTAVDAGWEVGLHASLGAWQSTERLAAEKRRLESVLGGYRVQGVRHHHWALEAGRAERTWRRQAEAGFRYDSSLGLNDVPGFRRGMAWPFMPFDPDQAAAGLLLQVPPTLMDGGLLTQPGGTERGVRQLRSHLHQVAHYGGAAVLDWHLEQLHSARLHGAGPILVRVLKDLHRNDDIYWATPLELAEWWAERSRRLAEQRTRRPSVSDDRPARPRQEPKQPAAARPEG